MSEVTVPSWDVANCFLQFPSLAPYLITIVHFLDCSVFTLFDSTYGMHPCPFIQITLSRSLSSRFQNGPDILQGGGQAGAGNEAEKSETMKKPTRRPGVKPPPDRAKRSIFLFKLKNPIRQFCITVSNGIQTLKFSPICFSSPDN